MQLFLIHKSFSCEILEEFSEALNVKCLRNKSHIHQLFVFIPASAPVRQLRDLTWRRCVTTGFPLIHIQTRLFTSLRNDAETRSLPVAVDPPSD